MRIGSSTVEITPDSPVELAGYGYYLDRMSTSVESPLVAHALTFEDGSGNRGALCSVDLLSVDQETVTKVEEAVKQADDEVEMAILINASHTHSGPGTHRLYGAGRYNPDYIDNILVPRLSSAILAASRNAREGEIGVASTTTTEEALSYNRTTGGQAPDDRRVTAVRVDTEEQRIAGAHFACHPVVYGSKSTVISSDYPGFARAALHEAANIDTAFWLGGSAGNIDPIVNRERKGATTQRDVEAMGRPIGLTAAALQEKITLGTGALRLFETVVELPVDTDFELDPVRETAIYREARGFSKLQDLSFYTRWLKSVAPVVNGNHAPTVPVPARFIAIGNIVFAGFGAEIYNETGLAIESQQPGLKVVTMMNTGEHQGYVPPREEYDGNSYAARSSAFIFGRKPLTPDSEAVFRQGVHAAISELATP